MNKRIPPMLPTVIGLNDGSEISFKTKLCEYCRGLKFNSAGECSHCKGEGVVVEQVQTKDISIQEMLDWMDSRRSV